MTEFDIDRRIGIGASEAPAVLGLDRYRTAADVWAVKVGQEPEPPENLAMRLGALLEPIVAELYAERTGIRIRRRRRAYFDPGHRFIYAHVDRLAADRVVEVKTTSSPGDEWGPDGSSEVPLRVMVQTLLQMRLARRPRADVAALLWGRDLRVYPLEYDRELADSIVERLAEFWHRYVETGQQPPLDGSDASREYLRRRYPADSGEELVLTPGNLPMITRLLAARADAERAEAERVAAENAVKEFMGEVAVLRFPTGRVSWRTQTSRRTDWQRVAEALAEGAGADHVRRIISEHTEQRTSRVFRVAEEKERL